MYVSIHDFIFRIFFRFLRHLFAFQIIIGVLLIFICLPIPIFLFLPLIYAGIIVVTYQFRRDVIDFTYSFYISGHWKKINEGHLHPRAEDDAPPDFRRLKILSWLFIILPAFFYSMTCIFLWMNLTDKAGDLRETIVSTVGAALLVFVHCFFGYWSLRGARFVEKYQPIS